MGYRDNECYQVLEELIKAAGVRIVYDDVPDDSYDGPLYAKTDGYNQIMMPSDPDKFPDDETAILVLGHEMGHIIIRNERTIYDPIAQMRAESECNLVGVYLTELALMIYEQRCKEALMAFEAESAVNNEDGQKSEAKTMTVDILEAEKPEPKQVTIHYVGEDEPEEFSDTTASKSQHPWRK